MTTREFYTRFDFFSDALQTFAINSTDDPTKARLLYQETAYRAFKMRNSSISNGDFGNWLIGIMKSITQPKAVA